MVIFIVSRFRNDQGRKYVYESDSDRNVYRQYGFKVNIRSSGQMSSTKRRNPGARRAVDWRVVKRIVTQEEKKRDRH